MRILIILLIITAIAEGQLNFNGNPLTENTEYTAEESQNNDERYDKIRRLKWNNEVNKKSSKSLATASTGYTSDNDNGKVEKSPKTMSIDVVPANVQLKDVSGNNNAKLMTSATMHQASPANPSIKVLDSTSSMQMQSREEYSANQRGGTEKIRVTPRQIASSVSTQALNSFLNSQTPQESHYALEKYLQAQAQASNQSPVQYDQNLNVPNYNAPAVITDTTKNNLFLPPTSLDSNQQIAEQTDNLSSNVQSIPEVQSTQKVYPNQLIRSPYYQGSKAFYRPGLPPPIRSPFYYPPGTARYPTKKYPQPRIAEYGQSMQIPANYPFTKRTNRRYGPYIPANPPVYHSAPNYPSAVTNPPMETDVLYSQLYSQSYDPYYYDYIAKTGKVKPWLYGKLGPKYREEPSMWNELYGSFKKHGMKNIMNPMFLLGLSIPALTLMLSAIISKRSFGRSADGDGYMNDEILSELEEKVRNAIEWYENNVVGRKDS